MLPSHKVAGLAIALALLAALASASAAVSVAPLFADHGVLQRDRKVSVWGTASAGESITVSFAGHVVTATADAAGHWQAWLPSMPANRIGTDLVVERVVPSSPSLRRTSPNTLEPGPRSTPSGLGTTRSTIHDILVGDVWLCAGQSNMGFALSHAAHAAEEIAAADYPLIRHVWITRSLQETPQTDFATTGWKAASPKTAGAFSAVSYFFARDLFQKTGVPIGLIVSSWPGTPIESWLSRPMLESDPAFAVVFQRWNEALRVFPEKKPLYDAALAKWTAAEPAATKNSSTLHAAYVKAHPAPALLLGPGHPYTPSGVYNGMIAPLLPTTLRGIIWYQGETNAGRPLEYPRMFATWVKGLRANLRQGDLPFFWVQLPNLKAGNAAGTNWALIRAGQSAALNQPNTGQAVAIDVGDPDNLHPTNKQPVGHRLALIAEAKVYGIPVEWSGPVMLKAQPEGSTVKIHFSHADGGLVARGGAVSSLEIAGPEGHFVSAEAKIEESDLIVSSSAVPNPTTVRYAWRNAPDANLYNQAGLPAAPFQTD